MAGPAATQAQVLQGTLERITFQNPETHFVVARLVPEGRGSRPVTVVGQLVHVHEGEWVRLEGRYEDDRSYGRQFRVTAFEAATPKSALGIERYLGGGLAKGVGGELAKRIVAHFGDETLKVLETEPERLLEVEGIGKKRKERLLKAWDEKRASRRVLVFLRGHGLGTAHASKVMKVYGERAVEIISKNPYRLAEDVWGIGFRTADRIGASLGIDKESPDRVEAGLSFAMREASERGHACFPRDRAVDLATELLGVSRETCDLAAERLVLMQALVQEMRPAADGEDIPWLWLPPLHTAESVLAKTLAKLLTTPSGFPSIHVEKALEWVESRRDIALAEGQRDALRTALTRKVCVITGGPGVGKTTVLASLLDIVTAKKVRVRLAAPTGRAAKRMESATGREALTIHRLLKWNPRLGDFEHDAENPIEGCDLLVLDEASMIDLPLMHRVVAALPIPAQLVITGDADQLPSVGPGSVLKDLITSGVVPTARLTEVHRQAAGSAIVRAAHEVHAGRLPALPAPGAPSELHFVEADDPEGARDVVTRLVVRDLPRAFGLDPLRDIQVLCPMHKGAAGIASLNRALEGALLREGAPFLSHGERRFAEGAKVIQLRNDYDLEVQNGDVGVVEEARPEDGKLIVRFEETGRRVEYQKKDLDELDLGYAISIHKSQGSEYPCVVLLLLKQHYMMLQRNLLYTAITRAKARVVVVGQRRAVELAVRRAESAARGSALAERLARCFDAPVVVQEQ